MIVDLHTHSNASDGALTPSDLVQRAHRDGVQLLSLTDHDTVSGLREAAHQAQLLNMAFVTGVEISTLWANKLLHVVALDFDPEHPAIAPFFENVKTKRIERAQKMAQKLQEFGISGAYEGALSFAATAGTLSRTHFAQWLLALGHVQTYNEAFDRFLGDGKPVNAPIEWPSLEKTLEFIHSIGAISVLAHPGRYEFDSILAFEAMLESFKKLGGDAIEVVSGSQSSQIEAHLHLYAKEYGFMASTGSDWHNPKGSRPQMGSQNPLPTGLIPVWSKIDY